MAAVHTQVTAARMIRSSCAGMKLEASQVEHLAEEVDRIVVDVTSQLRLLDLEPGDPGEADCAGAGRAVRREVDRAGNEGLAPGE